MQLLDFTDSKPLLGRLAKEWSASMDSIEAHQVVSIDEKVIESELNQNLMDFPLQELLFVLNAHLVLDGYPPQLLDSTEIYLLPNTQNEMELTCHFHKSLCKFAKTIQRHGF